MEYFNSSSAPTNQASLEDKGNIFARPELVVVTTNVPHFGTQKVSEVPAAFFRRLRYRISLSVKPEFRPHLDQNRVDKSKVLRSDTRDIHTYTVLEYQIRNKTQGQPTRCGDRYLEPDNDGSEVIEVPLLESVGQREFFEWYHALVVDHLEVSSALQRVDRQIVTSEMCSLCYMLETRCSCC